jgi:hypothetical protein
VANVGCVLASELLAMFRPLGGLQALRRWYDAGIDTLAPPADTTTTTTTATADNGLAPRKRRAVRRSQPDDDDDDNDDDDKGAVAVDRGNDNDDGDYAPEIEPTDASPTLTAAATASTALRMFTAAQRRKLAAARRRIVLPESFPNAHVIAAYVTSNARVCCACDGVCITRYKQPTVAVLRSPDAEADSNDDEQIADVRRSTTFAPFVWQRPNISAVRASVSCDADNTARLPSSLLSGVDGRAQPSNRSGCSQMSDCHCRCVV